MSILLFAVGCLTPDYFWLNMMREELPMKRRTILPFAMGCHLCSLVFAKLFAVIEFGRFSVSDGMRLYGGLFSMPLIIYVSAKAAGWKLADAFDIIGVSTIYSILIFRLNCFMLGCCGGTAVPWRKDLQWPIRELEIVLDVVLLIIYIPKVRERRSRGEVYPVLLTAYGAVRFFLEWFREEYVSAVGILHWAHIWSLLSLTVGLSVLFTLKSREKRKAGR